ncbi:hypothetical protein [Neobacillus thermocopriae]|nr:hypothetical protein [Neobacillus thermocopriae]MED3625170.1 hypothetical protein [Neobacillus thermocopriae]MED3715758.1 hypothetical protein [Neobacillus thermocopriae]
MVQKKDFEKDINPINDSELTEQAVENEKSSEFDEIGTPLNEI